MAATDALTGASEEFVEVVGEKIRCLQSGSGDPLIVLHHDIGNPGWLPFYEQLAQRFTVTVPDFPGWGQSERPVWMRSVRDLAVELNLLLDQSGIEQATLVGLGFGGWVAAEMATMNQSRCSRLVLVGATGLQPAEGEILDQFLHAHMDYVKMGFHDVANFHGVYGEEPPTEQLMDWDVHREMVARIAWKPYLFSQTLPHLLPGLKTPTLVVWGSDDRIVPRNCGELYRDALPNGRLEVIEGAGHFVEMEKPDDLSQLVLDFAGA